MLNLLTQLLFRRPPLLVPNEVADEWLSVVCAGEEGRVSLR